jgi:hypothetical protein
MVLAYGIISKGLEAAQRLTATYLGSNPFALKELHYAKWEAIFGSALLAVGFVAALAAKQFPDFGVAYPQTQFTPIWGYCRCAAVCDFGQRHRRQGSGQHCVPQGQTTSFRATG